MKYLDLDEFIELGILHEANRHFFHPLGLALEVSEGEDGIKFLSNIWDCRDDEEGVLFTSISKDKISKFKEFSESITKRREGALGFIIQENDLE